MIKSLYYILTLYLLLLLFYHTNLYQTEHLNPEMIDKSQVNVHSYHVLDYIELGEFKDTVENNKKLIDQDTKKIIKI